MRYLVRLIVAGLVLLPILMAATSPLLAWRQPVYIAAGFAGIGALGLLFVQPLLIAGVFEFGHPLRARRVHRFLGAALIGAITAHVIGLWLTSPPDVIDALLFRSPTPFSVWGVSAMWLLFLAGALVLFRRKLALRHRSWSLLHRLLVTSAVCGTVIHALTITGTMEIYSKWLICAATVCAMIYGVWWKRR